MRQARTLVASEAALLQAFEAPSIKLPWGAVLVALAFGGVLVLAGSFAAWPTWLAWLGGLLALAALVHGIRVATRQRRLARARRKYEIEQRVIGLAFCNDGLLSAALVSDTLRIAVVEAQELLGQLVNTARARAELSVENGETIYHFSEAKRTRGLRRSQSTS